MICVCVFVRVRTPVWKPEQVTESTDPLELELHRIVSHQCGCGCWEPNLGPYRKSNQLVTMEPSLQSPDCALTEFKGLVNTCLARLSLSLN